MDICHFDRVDHQNIEANFPLEEHRSFLKVPFQERPDDGEYLCVIGQNPSMANEDIADKTLHYLERYVYEKLPRYKGIIMLNLYSRIDTKKEKTEDLLADECEKQYLKIIDQSNDFLLVYGKAKKEGAYDFPSRIAELRELLSGKNVFKIDIDTSYPPHPGNPKIYYGNFCHGITEHAV